MLQVAETRPILKKSKPLFELSQDRSALSTPIHIIYLDKIEQSAASIVSNGNRKGLSHGVSTKAKISLSISGNELCRALNSFAHRLALKINEIYKKIKQPNKISVVKNKEPFEEYLIKRCNTPFKRRILKTLIKYFESIGIYLTDIDDLLVELLAWLCKAREFALLLFAHYTIQMEILLIFLILFDWLRFRNIKN